MLQREPSFTQTCVGLVASRTVRKEVCVVSIEQVSSKAATETTLHTLVNLNHRVSKDSCVWD